MTTIWGELKRRNVVRVGIAYAVVAWLVLQVADVILNNIEAPLWVFQAILLLLAIGFPIALIFAWAFEITPEGLKKDNDVDRSQSTTHVTGRKLDFVIIGVLAIAVAYFTLDKFYWHGDFADTALVADPLAKSIAVLPFDNRSADESDIYFVDGIHDDVLTQLHKLSGIDKVISRTTMDRYRDTDKSIPQIAEELGVATILEGGVQRAGDTVRINVQLIAAANDEYLWAEIYDRPLTTDNVFAIQSEIAIAIAEALQAALTDDESADLEKLPTESLEAYEAYQIGKYVMRERSVEGIENARLNFEEAIRIDPEFALAHVGLAEALTLQVVWGVPDDEALNNDKVEHLGSAAVVAAERALDINPRLGEAFVALGYAHFNLAWIPQYGAESILLADKYYREALDLVPNDASLYRWYPQALILRPLNQPVRALAMAERAIALDPMLGINYGILAGVYEINGRLEEAIQANERAVELSPALGFHVGENVRFLLRRNEFVRAIVRGQRSAAPDLGTQGSQLLFSAIALSYRHLDDIDRYRYWSANASRFNYVPYSDLALALAAVIERDFDLAVEHFGRSLDQWADCWDCIHHIAHIKAKNEDPASILEFIGRHAPGLVDRNNPEVWPQAALVTATAAQAFIDAGEHEHAEMIIELALPIARKGIRQADMGYGVEIAEIELLIVQGKHRLALDALTRAIDEGYRSLDWLEISHILDPIRNEPEFIAAMDVIRADLDAQRAELEEMERRGELPPLPQ